VAADGPRVHRRLYTQGPALSAQEAPATVLWWEQEQGDVTAWLAVRAGSPPLAHEAWLAQSAVPALQPGDWAAVSSIPLGGMGQELSAWLRDPIGSGRPGLGSVAFAADARPLVGEASAELYDACRAAARTLVTERARDEIVAREPRGSGLRLLRVSADRRGLDIAPAIDEPAWRGGPIDVHLGSDAGAPTFVTETVTLGAIATVLPCARIRFERAVGSIPARLPKLFLPGAPDPLVHLRFG
jgi:hypothetical protein